MKHSGKVYVRGSLGHVYQRSVSGFVIFYTIEDYLMFFMIFCSLARKHHVRILGLCLMVDHIHFLVQADCLESISKFVQEYSIAFVRAYNKEYGFHGSLLRSSFGISSKVGDKKKRTAIAYLYNNPVEKKLCRKCEEYRWNFLAYANSDHPFSEKLILSKASAGLRRAIRFVRLMSRSGRVVVRQQLNKMFSALSIKEKNQLADFIIRTYSCIQYEKSISYYGSYPQMVQAINSNTGSEYDLKEDFNPYSDRAFIRMANKVVGSAGKEGLKHLLHSSTEEKLSVLRSFINELAVAPLQAVKFLRLKGAVLQDSRKIAPSWRGNVADYCGGQQT